MKVAELAEAALLYRTIDRYRRRPPSSGHQFWTSKLFLYCTLIHGHYVLDSVICGARYYFAFLLLRMGMDGM